MALAGLSQNDGVFILRRFLGFNSVTLIEYDWFRPIVLRFS